MGKIKTILGEIVDPMSGYSILELGIVEKIMTRGRNLVIRVNLPKYSLAVRDYIVGEIKSKLITLPDVSNVIIQQSRTMRYPFF
jgi:metal-sulfur cluster biosynthetic enzyme